MHVELQPSWDGGGNRSVTSVAPSRERQLLIIIDFKCTLHLYIRQEVQAVQKSRKIDFRNRLGHVLLNVPCKEREMDLEEIIDKYLGSNRPDIAGLRLFNASASPEELRKRFAEGAALRQQLVRQGPSV